ncbi:mitochondrial inner membrane protein OXA1L-like isoform X1 [Mizuhopecten yessoensis]|uniref:mitochondrial inner membrane protein OXA1L-like isoform X1 n=2 Tax=Mizuhopecten yessoensis TaxID=6573 RepID=UPI000B45A6CC|nr:mitochondrial inner membrane protein OXA1L-like isoform X1 [Mizuhopecten yessoensis]
MAALRHVRTGFTSKWINLLGGQSSVGHFNETALKEGRLNTIQKRWFHPTNLKKFHDTGTQSSPLSAGLISSRYGVGPTWSVLSAQRQRYNSTDATQTTPATSGYILEPPSLPDVIDVSQTVNALGEPSLASMGLGNYTPSGLYQHGLEFLHVGVGMPWWEAILVSTILVRVLSIPLAVLSQRVTANSMNHKPKMDKLQEKLSEAKLNKNMEQYARANLQLTRFMKETNTNPLRSMMYPMLQMPIFLSVFIGLRKMAYYPVESMMDGGLWWFIDLTTSDPLFILPFLTSATLLLSIELGSDGVSSKTVGTNTKYVVRAIPIIMIPVMMYFPAGLNLYWLTSNLCGLAIASFLRQDRIRKMCKIPVKIIHPVSETEKKPFKQVMKDGWAQFKRKQKMKETANQTMADFKKAGTGPLTKTYAADPTLSKRKQLAKIDLKKSEIGPLTKTYATDPTSKKKVTKSLH